MLKANENSKIFKYEEFLNKPEKQMTKICDALGIRYENYFDDIFSLFKVTGDSGRKGDAIGARKKIVDDDLTLEVESSNNYKLVFDLYR